MIYSEAIRKEIRDLKRNVQNEKRMKEMDKINQVEESEKKKQKSEIMKDYVETQEKYKEAKAKLPKKGKTREDLTMEMFNKFKNKLQQVKEHANDDTSNSGTKTTSGDTEDDDADDKSWMRQSLHCEEKAPVLAKDASTKDDDWFEIYDPRNPLNKRRRGEKTHKSQDDKSGKKHSRYR